MVCVTLMDVAHISGLSHHLLSLRLIAEVANKYIGTRKSIRVVSAKSGDELFTPSYGRLNGLFVYCTDTSSEGKAHIRIAPGATPTPQTATDINDFHCSEGYRPVKLVTTRAVKPAELCFVDLAGPKSVRPPGGKEYMMIVIYDFSRFTGVFFLLTKYITVMYFSKYLAEITPRKVKVVRSNGGGGFLESAFGALCTTEKIRQELTTAGSPQYNGAAERQIVIIEEADFAARVQAAAKYPNEVFPRGESMWVEQAD